MCHVQLIYVSLIRMLIYHNNVLLLHFFSKYTSVYFHNIHYDNILYRNSCILLTSRLINNCDNILKTDYYKLIASTLIYYETNNYIILLNTLIYYKTILMINVIIK